MKDSPERTDTLVNQIFHTQCLGLQIELLLLAEGLNLLLDDFLSHASSGSPQGGEVLLWAFLYTHLDKGNS